ncbi:cytochrome P450 [Amanita rubescens]|nr:cytochrome P450 [Amanita rubescens]
MPDITSTILGSLPIDLSQYTLNKSITLATTFALLVALSLYRVRRNRRRTPKLVGPPSKGLLFGVMLDIFAAPDLGALYADWERKYGPVYEIPSSLGSKVLVLGDPKGIAHLCANDTTTYQQLRFAKVFEQRFFGNILTVQEGETHRRMNYVSLDSIGKGGFSHDFQSLAGNHSPVMEAFDAFGSLKPTPWAMIPILMAPLFPRLSSYIPTEQVKLAKALSDGVREIAVKLLAKDAGDQPSVMDKSILGALIKSETASSSAQMSIEEIHAQVQMLMIAGYETTSVTLTWALIELARNPEIQNTLRAELEEHIPADEVTYEKLMNGLRYLDAFLSEILRLHPAGPETIREARSSTPVEQDDTIPLGQPIVTASGTVIDNLPVERGLIIRIPIIGVNRSEALWGPDAATFDPTRWLEEKAGDFNNKRKEEIQGYRHLLTFNHGPRLCLGRMFAITEVKAVLSVIVRKFAFEFPGGPETKLGSHQSINLRPKVVGEEGPRVPLIVRKVFG